MKHFSILLRKILLCSYLYYLLLFLCFIYIFIYVINYEVKSNYNINDTSFILTVRDIKIDGDKISFTFKEDLIGNYYFESLEEKNEFNIKLNDKISVNGTLNIPSNNSIPNGFNYKKYLNNKGILYILTIDSFSLYKENNNIFYKIKNNIYDRVSNIDNNDYLYAFILGKSSYLDGDIYNNYKINGVTHLFALSGLHVSLFSSCLLLILKKLKFNEVLSFILVSLFLLFFSFIASFSPSILRATLFFVFSNINKIFSFFIKPKFILYLVFIILSLYNPLYIYNTGFILSFVITFFILIFNENYKVNGSMKSTLVISLLSFLSSLPIIINMSYEVNIIGFINNLVFIPLVSYIVFPLSLMTLFFPFLSKLLYIFTYVMELLSLISSKYINLTIIFRKLNIYHFIFYYIFLILIIKRKKKYVICFLLVIISFFIDVDNSTKVYFIDVGQGDAALIVSENNKSILIDTGGVISYYKDEWKKRKREFNLMTNSVIPFFKSIGVRKIDYLFLTHGDNDHLGYSLDLINNFNVNNIYINRGKVNYAESKLNYKIFYDEYLKVDNIEIYSLNNIDYGNENDNSLVFLVKIYDYNILFTADASYYVEDDILNKYDLPKIDILKVGHHGSDTSTGVNLVNKIKPDISVISVGKNNKYGHPSNSVLKLLKESKIYRTDIDGSVVITFNEDDYVIDNFSPGGNE